MQNRLYSEKIGAPNYKPGDTLPRFGYRRICNTEELYDILRTGYMMPKDGKSAKYFTLSDSHLPPKGIRSGTVVRVKSENIPFDAPVNVRHVELWDNENGTFFRLTYPMLWMHTIRES